MQELALGLNLPVGGDSGQPGSLDGFAAAEQALASAAAGQPWSAHVVRSGELRGNGPLLMADLSARLVDNLYDVKYQDLYFRSITHPAQRKPKIIKTPNPKPSAP
jgi:hypothetical protein